MLQTHLVPKIMHQKFAVFLQQLYYDQIQFLVLVPVCQIRHKQFTSPTYLELRKVYKHR